MARFESYATIPGDMGAFAIAYWHMETSSSESDW